MSGSRKKLVSATGILLVAIPFAWWVTGNNLIVTNESGQTIRALSVEVCERTIRFGDLESGATVTGSFGTPRDESSFRLRGMLADGTVLDETCGYVVWEDYGQQFRLVIGPGGAAQCSSGR
jgi:hypothetical protein